MTNTYLCDSCRQYFPFSDVKYNKDGSKLLCAKCQSKKQENPEAPPKDDRLKLICTNCRYKFSVRIGAALKCPYCGKEKVVRDETTADRLLAEVSKNSDLYR